MRDAIAVGTDPIEALSFFEITLKRCDTNTRVQIVGKGCPVDHQIEPVIRRLQQMAGKPGSQIPRRPCDQDAHGPCPSAEWALIVYPVISRYSILTKIPKKCIIWEYDTKSYQPIKK